TVGMRKVLEKWSRNGPIELEAGFSLAVALAKRRRTKMLQDIQFRDSQVQKCFERNMAEVADRSAQMSQVGALMAVCDMFRLVEGPHSPRVHEAIEHLLAPGLRPILRNWYR